MQVRESLQKGTLDGLNLVVEELNLMGALLSEVLVEFGHRAGLTRRLTIPVLEVGVHAARMDDLVRWSQCQVEEARDGDVPSLRCFLRLRWREVGDLRMTSPPSNETRRIRMRPSLRNGSDE